MTIRIEILQHAVRIETRHIPRPSASFGHAAPDPVVGAAALISVAALLVGIGQIAGMI